MQRSRYERCSHSLREPRDSENALMGTVEGDEMVPFAFPKATVIVEPGRVFEPGSKVLVDIGERRDLIRIFMGEENGFVTLRCENPTYEDELLPRAQVKIRGKLTRVVGPVWHYTPDWAKPKQVDVVPWSKIESRKGEDIIASVFAHKDYVQDRPIIAAPSPCDYGDPIPTISRGDCVLLIIEEHARDGELVVIAGKPEPKFWTYDSTKLQGIRVIGKVVEIRRHFGRYRQS
ncbi:MAG: S24 family peptidase [Chloroflexota bacterium]|nr:MAG: S24 family peptidase [Chloroflexota bacterium]